MVLIVGFKVETAILAPYCFCDTGFNNVSVYFCAPCCQVDSSKSNYSLVLWIKKMAACVINKHLLVTSYINFGDADVRAFSPSLQSIFCTFALLKTPYRLEGHQVSVPHIIDNKKFVLAQFVVFFRINFFNTSSVSFHAFSTQLRTCWHISKPMFS